MFTENKRNKKCKTLKMKRKVLFKKYIQVQYSCEYGKPSKRIEGTGMTESEFKNEGIFHGFGFSIEEEALEIANVTRQEIEAYPTMYGIYKKIEAMLSKYVDKFNKKDKFYLAGFNNAGFDNPFFRAFFTQNATTQKEADYGNYFGSWFWSDSFDVMILASYYLRKERSEMPNFQLKTVAKQLGIEVDETKLHDAKYDIFLTYEIFKIVTNQ